jgi:integrase
MAVKWQGSKYPGVRFYEHETRIHNRKKDRYHAIRFHRDGKRIEEGIGWVSDGMTLEEAQVIRGRIIKNIKKGIAPQSFAEMRAIKERDRQNEIDQAEAERLDAVTFGEMAGLFLAWAEDNKKSYRDDKTRYEKHLEKRFKNVTMRDLSPFHLERLKSSLKRSDLSPATVTQCLQLVRGIFNRTRAWGRHACEFPAVDFPRVQNRRVAWLTAEQAHALMDAVKAKSLQVWGQCVLSLYAGLRFGEIARLELSDLDFDAGTIHVRDGKGGTRHAYITEPIASMFAEWWTVADKAPGLIFPARPSEKRPRGGRQARVSPIFSRTVDDLGLNQGIKDDRQKIVFHTLRHTFASWLVMDGASLQTVMELMGHKDIQTTMRYAHLAPDIKRNAAHDLSKTMGRRPEKKKILAVKK